MALSDFFFFSKIPIFNPPDFEIPVRIRKGSWEALIPQNIADWIQAAIIAGGSVYAGAALKKMAENDFKDIGFKDIFKEVIKTIKWVIKIAEHVNSMEQKKFEHPKFNDDNSLIGISNIEDEVLWVPKKYIDRYIKCPEGLFSKIADIIESERELVIGINKREAQDEDDKTDVRVGVQKKHIFVPKEAESEVLFPELKHNEYVEIEGHITKGNENSNNIGFQYKEHILSCYPAQGSITQHKDRLFTNSVIKGHIDRLDKDGKFERKPKIRFIDLSAIEEEITHLPLLDR